MIKYTSLFLTALMLILCLSCCGSGISSVSRLNIVTTVFPVYDWVRNILGENKAGAEVSMLLESGVDLHSLQPSAEDNMKISVCDLFIYIGGVSESWVNDALKQATNKNIRVLNLLDILGDSANEEEITEGMHEHHHEDEHDENAEYDEHIWLSLRNAEVFVEAISSALVDIDPENAEIYKANTEAYASELRGLDEKYVKAVSQSGTKTLIFADRFPFRYLFEDYGLEYYAAFAGCSAETEATFETVIFLSGKIDELSLGAVITTDGSDCKLALSVIENTKSKDQKILTLDSLQSITAKDIENGAEYLSIMEDNLEMLKAALN